MLPSRVYDTVRAVYMRVLAQSTLVTHTRCASCLSDGHKRSLLIQSLSLFRVSQSAILQCSRHQSKWDTLFVIKRKETITESWVIKEKSCHRTPSKTSSSLSRRVSHDDGKYFFGQSKKKKKKLKRGEQLTIQLKTVFKAFAINGLAAVDFPFTAYIFLFTSSVVQELLSTIQHSNGVLSSEKKKKEEEESQSQPGWDKTAAAADDEQLCKLFWRRLPSLE